MSFPRKAHRSAAGTITRMASTCTVLSAGLPSISSSKSHLRPERWIKVKTSFWCWKTPIARGPYRFSGPLSFCCAPCMAGPTGSIPKRVRGHFLLLVSQLRTRLFFFLAAPHHRRDSTHESHGCARQKGQACALQKGVCGNWACTAKSAKYC
jgi:hypothetical protein